MDYNDYLEQYVAYDNILMRRCWAAIIDFFAFFTILTIYGYMFGEVEIANGDNGTFGFNVNPGFFPTILTWLLYFPFLESQLGYTPGKGLLDLKVIQEDRKDMAFIVSFKRHLLDPIDYFFFGIVGILLVKFSKDHKRLGDRWAKSRVIKEIQ